MKIALNAQLISTAHGYRSAGVSGYSLNLLRALGALRGEGATAHDFTAFVNDPALDVPGVGLQRTRLPLHRPPARILWEQTILPRRAAGMDLLHGLVNVLPLASPVPGVVTVHDLAFVRAAQTLPPFKRWYLANLCRASAQSAAAVIAVSTQTADDLLRFFDVPAGKITVVPNGVGPEFSPAPPPQGFCARHNLPERFFLFVGTLEPRKNLPRIVRAYAAWRSRTTPQNRDIQLVIVGGIGWYYAQIFAEVRALQLEEWVTFAGYAPAQELPDWYRAAFAFVYPSLFEGFGLPILEAMASGLPVITSTAPSLAEVAGDAALCVEPEDVDALSAALHLITDQPALRDELRARGLQRAAGYSWQRCARETIAVYESVASPQSSPQP